MNTQFTLPPREFEPSIFRAYDIRGIVDKTLNDDTVYAIGRAFAAQCLADQISQVTLAADGRLSSPAYKRILAQGLVDGGMQVTDIGFAATPILYFAVVNSDSQTGIMITGSHNPVDYNGFKLMIAGDTYTTLEADARSVLFNCATGLKYPMDDASEAFDPASDADWSALEARYAVAAS